ncbi:MAG: peptide chain release factor N(5)-glutamine methyltransferase [Ruminococcus sp.]
MTPGQAQRFTRQQMEEAGLESARFESRVLVETVLGISGSAGILPETPLTEAQAEQLAQLTKRRCAHEPLQYLCGTWEFFGLEFAVGEGVLIPRQDTETLVETVLELRRSAEGTHLLDLCSGSGCIPAAIAAHLEHVTGDAVELSEQALPYLRQNLNRHAPQIRIHAADALQPPAVLAGEQYDVITCNPPYLTEEDMAQLQPEVTFEPETALLGGKDGLAFYRNLTPIWKAYLKEDGWLVYETGMGQGQAVKEMLEQAGFSQCRIIPDLAGIDRVVIGKKQ